MTDADPKAAVWEPIPRRNLSADVAERVIASVLDGTFKLGDRLPSERELATRLQVARPTLREALSALHVIGVIEVLPGEGTFIVSHHADFVARAFGWAMLLDAGAAQDVIDARTAVECGLVRLAAERAEDGELVEILEIAERTRSARGHAAFVEVDLAFHHRVAVAARSQALLRSFEGVRELVATWIDTTARKRSTRVVAAEHHEAVARALLARDPDAAEIAMRTHLEQMGRLLIESAGRLGVSSRSDRP